MTPVIHARAGLADRPAERGIGSRWCQWIPFGGGPHHCPGFKFAEVQIKAIVHQLVRRYRWSVAAGYSMPVQQAPISKPRDGLPVAIQRL